MVSSPSTSGSPSETSSVADAREVVPLNPDADAVHRLAAVVAVNTSSPDMFTLSMSAELVTDPPAPGVPWVLTASGPEVNSVAGPNWALPDGTPAVTGDAEP